MNWITLVIGITILLVGIYISSGTHEDKQTKEVTSNLGFITGLMSGIGLGLVLMALRLLADSGYAI
jgi:uncharacterized membrane protein